ncbi:amidohydrolase family protein [Fimbriiglobus ruber]|uniref:Chlorohydrolase, Atz/Trz family n=1 Tax=Fimbriiglobus ruber TaxID=1908690 RepID=A0A225E4Q6_9BACT|nr:amidohydrolase family protein [Fimbriiglobus ruber]OWK43665.1 Chlorohydrolase, Atz/Trz family [Fimbriiglobus ruber]
MSDTRAESRTYTARWVFPASNPPLHRGTVTVSGSVIEAVDPHGVRQPDEDLGNVAIIPGLVNAHTHLDLSGARGLTPPTTADRFTDWLLSVITYRRSRSPEQTRADIHAGLAESLRCGTTLIGDIAAEGQTWDVLAAAPTRAVVFRELIGLSPERSQTAHDTAETWLAGHHPTTSTRPGLSPHAPYSVRKGLFADAGRLCRSGKISYAVHLAESAAEVELLTHRRGPFADFLKDLGLWLPDGLTEDFGAVIEACDFGQPKLFVHGNHLAPTTRMTPGSTIVYCPRTHAAFGHPPHPFREFLARGVRVCLGTDSLASNPDLDVLAEARFIHSRYPDFPGDTLLKMVTLFGAEAMDWSNKTGSLEPGKSADLVAVPLPERDAEDAHTLLFAQDAPRADRRSMFCGLWRSWMTVGGNACFANEM